MIKINNIELLESQVRQVFASVVWTHKIQEKQADIYRRQYNALETVRIIASAVTTSGIIATVFIEGNVVKIATALISIITLFINSYFKVYDLKKLYLQHKNSALQLVELRERIICLLCDIKMEKLSEGEIIKERDSIQKDLLEAYRCSNDVSERAVSMASDNLKNRKDNTFSDEEIDCFLPIVLRKNR